MDVAGELHVELDDVCGQVGEQVEAGVAGAEVVECDGETLALVLLEDGTRRWAWSTTSSFSVIFEDQLARWESRRWRRS